MDFARQQRNPARHLAGLAFVALMHIVVIYALVNGLAHKVIEVIHQPLETTIIQEVKPPEKVAVLPPPTFEPPPPAFVPPPEVRIQTPVVVQNTITAVTTEKSVEPPPPPQPVPVPVETVTPPRFDAAYLENPAPQYPTMARRRGYEGQVVLRVRIRTDGTPEKVEIAKSSGYKVLDEAAFDAVRRWRFVPAKRGNETVAAWVDVPLTFKLK